MSLFFTICREANPLITADSCYQTRDISPVVINIQTAVKALSTNIKIKIYFTAIELYLKLMFSF